MSQSTESFACAKHDYFGLGAPCALCDHERERSAATDALPARYPAVTILHRPDDVAVLELGALRLVIYLDPWGASRAGWFARSSGRLLGWAAVGSA